MNKKSDPEKWCASGHISAGKMSDEDTMKEFYEELGTEIEKDKISKYF